MPFKKTIMLASAVATLAFAPPSFAQDPGQVATNACQGAIRGEVKNKYPQARQVQFLGANLRQPSNAETGVRGQGRFDSSGGQTQFSYDCVFNIRNGKTYALDVRNLRPVDQPGPQPQAKKDNGAALVGGLLLGAIVAGAIASSAHDDNQNRPGPEAWFNPAPGIQCSADRGACYERGQVSSYWTNRVYGH